MPCFTCVTVILHSRRVQSLPLPSSQFCSDPRKDTLRGRTRFKGPNVYADGHDMSRRWGFTHQYCSMCPNWPLHCRSLVVCAASRGSRNCGCEQPGPSVCRCSSMANTRSKHLRGMVSEKATPSNFHRPSATSLARSSSTRPRRKRRSCRRPPARAAASSFSSKCHLHQLDVVSLFSVHRRCCFLAYPPRKDGKSPLHQPPQPDLQHHHW